MWLLEQDTIKKGWVDKKVMELEFEAGKSEEYKLETIWDSAVYANEAEVYLLGLYYLVAWKKYPEKDNIWEPLSTIQHLKKLINLFHKKHTKKPTTNFLIINFSLLMAKPIVKPTRAISKRKQGWPAKSANKQARNWVLNTCNIWSISSLIAQEASKELSF